MNVFRKYLSLTTAISLLLQQASPLYGMEQDPEEKEKHFLSSKTKKKNFNNSNKELEEDKKPLIPVSSKKQNLNDNGEDLRDKKDNFSHESHSFFEEEGELAQDNPFHAPVLSIEKEFKTYNGFTQLRKKNLEADLDKYFEQNKFGKRCDFKTEESFCRDQRKKLFKTLRALKGNAQTLTKAPSSKESLDLVEQTTHNAKSALDDYLRNTSIESPLFLKIKEFLTTVPLRYRESPETFSRWIQSDGTIQAFKNATWEKRIIPHKIKGILETVESRIDENSQKLITWIGSNEAIQAFKTVKSDLDNWKILVIPDKIKDILQTIGFKLNEKPQILATWITSKDAEQVFHTLGIWNTYFDWYKPITEIYYRVTQYTEFMETLEFDKNKINLFAYLQLGWLGHLIDHLIPSEWDQSQKKWEIVVKESDSIKRKEGMRELFYRSIPWKLLKYCGSLPQEYLSASPYNFLTQSLHEFKGLTTFVSYLREQELSFWEGAPSSLEKQYKEYLQKVKKFERIEYLGRFFQGYINLRRIGEFADIEEQSKKTNNNEEPFTRALDEQEQEQAASHFRFGFTWDEKLQEELNKRRSEGEFLSEKKGVLIKKVQTFKRLRVLQGIGECIKELSPDFIRLLGLSDENVKTLRKIRDNLFHPEELMFKRLESILLNSEGVLVKCEEEILNIFKAILHRRFSQLFDDFRRVYFENFGNSNGLGSFLNSLPKEKFSMTSLENLQKSLKPQKKSKKQSSSKNPVTEFEAAKEDLLKSWEYLGTITSRFRTQEIPDTTMMPLNSVYRKFSDKYAPLFENENVFSYAIEFLLSSFRESCKITLQNFDQLIDYTQSRDIIFEYKRQLATLNTHFIAAKEIAHNGDLSLNWDASRKFVRSHYEFISQDLLGGYRYKILGVPREEDEFTFVGETQEPSFLEFLKSVKISGKKATFSKTGHLD